ncbi:MAG: anti-sigma factor antagonist [Caldilinea sp. CFX5]|nr:anti-sigma factor antagonist [Caldilinea sp. CFX5]
MNLQLTSFDNITVLKIAGRIDSHSVQRLRQQLALSASGPGKNIILDLAGVDFIDSSGLAAIVHGMKQCRAVGGDLRLCKPPQAVRMVLELTRLDKALDIFPSQESALLSFATTMPKVEMQVAI